MHAFLFQLMDNGDSGVYLANVLSLVETDTKREPESVMHLLQPTEEKNVTELIVKPLHAMLVVIVLPTAFGQVGQHTLLVVSHAA